MGPYELLQKIVEVFERLRIPYLVTGSVAAMAYGSEIHLRLDGTLRTYGDLGGCSQTDKGDVGL